MVSTSSIALQKAIIEEYVPFLSDVLLKAESASGRIKSSRPQGKGTILYAITGWPRD